MAMLIEPLNLTTPIAAFNGGLMVNPDMSVVEQHVLPANKGAVARYLSARYQIPPEEIATIGDAANDVLMFAHSGLSIAMGNASLECSVPPGGSPPPTPTKPSPTPSRGSSSPEPDLGRAPASPMVMRVSRLHVG